MNETLQTQKNQSFHQSKLFGLPRSVAGAIIGIVLFILIYFASDAAGLEILPTALLAPGIMLSYSFGSSSNFLVYVIVFGISAIPFAVLGSLFGSKNKGLIIIGISLLMMYLIVSTGIALGIYAVFAADY